MPKSDAVWGIDIGQCALKALRCRPHHADPTQIVADAFDYVEYPQILSQPGADAAELIREAIQVFLSRNSVKGDQVAISVPGQNGLARFIKLPPVEAKKIPDMVRYEARQQIPFNLSEVVWDYQRMGNDGDQEGFALETEIGLFAIKREQMIRVLEPFTQADIDVDLVQLTPLALYNYICFDQLGDFSAAGEYDPEKPPPSIVVLSLGTDASDLVVTNGYRVWQRPVPIGGNHFTRALAAEMKLTFPKAEHLKRNAASAQDPKAVFRALSPMFKEMVDEVHRSINFFQSMNRAATIQRIYAVGNAIKLPGLRRYLEQKLEIEVIRVDVFNHLQGAMVVANSTFQENLGCFGVCYGLAVQGLKKGCVHTNLLPVDFARDRLIREKKPWAVAAIALLLLAFAVSYASFARALSTVDKSLFGKAESKAGTVAQTSNNFKSKVDALRAHFDETKKSGQAAVGNIEGRYLWAEMLRAINACLPMDEIAESSAPQASEPVYRPIENRNELHISTLECEWTDNVQPWYTRIYLLASVGKAVDTKAWHSKDASAGGLAGQDPTANASPNGDAAPGIPEGPGFIVRLRGTHYHNYSEANKLQGAQYVQETLIKAIKENKVELPVRGSDKPMKFSLKELGIQYPVLINPKEIRLRKLENPNVEETTDSAENKPSATAAGRAPKIVNAREFNFTVEMIWQPIPSSQRVENRQKAEQASAEAAPTKP